MNDDPDFEVASSSTSSKTSNSSTPFLLRSACHHLGPCNEGHGLQFHSRISPSPARSFHRRRRRKTKDSSMIDESEHDENISNLRTGEKYFFKSKHSDFKWHLESNLISPKFLQDLECMMLQIHRLA